jgi:glycosyltransferase involved in cell wall biosynthesis
MRVAHPILVSHPTVNPYVRALLTGLHREGLLSEFHTTLAFGRRGVDLPRSLVCQHPGRELIRLLSQNIDWRFLTKHETGFASVDAVAQAFDRIVSRQLPEVSGVYCYEDSALDTFRVAATRGIRRLYELPILYWSEVRRLLSEEADRYPEWEPTLLSTRESLAKLQRKSDELCLADLVICPSRQVQSSLPAGVASVVAEYGCPGVGSTTVRSNRERVRLLFVGSLSQRKGLADLFSAVKWLNRSDVELVLLGTPLMPLEFYRRQYADFVYEPTRPNVEVRRFMSTCDVLVLPSIVEGRALVQMEAMSCGLPIVVTPNAGAEDLVVDGSTGFLVPIRAPEKLAETIDWIADHRDWPSDARPAVLKKAAESGWDTYVRKVMEGIDRVSGL